MGSVWPECGAVLTEKGGRFEGKWGRFEGKWGRFEGKWGRFDRKMGRFDWQPYQASTKYFVIHILPQTIKRVITRSARKKTVYVSVNHNEIQHVRGIGNQLKRT